MYRPITFENEVIWVDLECLNIKHDLYQISNFGKIMNKKSGKLLSTIVDTYLSTQLMNNNNTRSTYRIHVLVAIMFIINSDPENKIFVNHKDLCKFNNRIENLEWITPQENVDHAIENGAREIDYSTPYINNHNWSHGEITAGEDNGMSRLTNKQIHFICKALEDGFNYGNTLEIAGLEVNENNRFIVSHIAQGLRWQSISCLYNIPSAKKFMNYDEYIIGVCKLLQDGKRTGEIIRELNLPGTYEQCRGFIGRIRRRDAYLDISKDYNW